MSLLLVGALFCFLTVMLLHRVPVDNNWKLRTQCFFILIGYVALWLYAALLIASAL